ncbi:hypothetical protein Kpol_1023p42 [Vanderwaltozyma polyspora DSM 70294]|uniref:Altered inheritance of mitochondria protein 24, mitochondrial n=1 Tax=Vanderwaltozyma polyspora (strain ATCC 22028 / DSM 70294 / BCRC 21397 / CBS 2163 / NBRC 10782 / NRRL Y-8283 / UCD 57-17) TaxID=436907 RepID=A7TFR5_VANPO|nr:uncharacterized protein Kpol_1023p42 [Vanderwaltozyma polyspora DSM 70294]EDO18873.1 hypothetical protein Kpol_1023p42 [Vanderwaltozyma polyspora DSM 70294]
MLLRRVCHPILSTRGALSFSKRFMQTNGKVIDNFTRRKGGTGSGPFVELPEFEQLQDSIIAKLPAYCTIYGNLNKICALNVDSNALNGPFLAEDSEEINCMTKFATKEYPANLMMSSPVPASSIAILKLDDYKSGIKIRSFDDNVLCYSGDLSKSDDSIIKGLGVVALCGSGSTYRMSVQKDEVIMITPESLLAHDSNLKLELIGLRSHFKLPLKLKQFIIKYANHFYEDIMLYSTKFFKKDKMFYKIKGPGTIILQNNFIPQSKLYSNEELIKTIK